MFHLGTDVTDYRIDDNSLSHPSLTGQETIRYDRISKSSQNK